MKHSKEMREVTLYRSVETSHWFTLLSQRHEPAQAWEEIAGATLFLAVRLSDCSVFFKEKVELSLQDLV